VPITPFPHRPGTFSFPSSARIFIKYFASSPNQAYTPSIELFKRAKKYDTKTAIVNLESNSSGVYFGKTYTYDDLLKHSASLASLISPKDVEVCIFV
jgi:hypothetical protein